MPRTPLHEAHEPSDEELMLAYVDGDDHALSELVRRYAPVLERVLRRGLNNADDARDMVQQTFLQLHRARHDFRRDAKLRPWLFTIAYNVRNEHFRRMKRRPETPLLLDGRNDPRVEEHGSGIVAATDLHAALEQLPMQQRTAVELHWLEGMSFPEVAEQLGTSLSAVKVRAHRGYKSLRTLLA